MGFFDTLKKGAEYAKKGMDKADEMMTQKAERMSDSEIRELLNKNPNNKYAKFEVLKRGL